MIASAALARTRMETGGRATPTIVIVVGCITTAASSSIVNGALARVLANEAAGHDRQKVTALGVGRGRWAITTAILVRRRQCF